VIFAVTTFVLHAIGIRALDALGLADRLFASGASAPVPALALAAVLLVRLLLYFVAPGWVIGALVYVLTRRRRVAVTEKT
jgi:hypothetical protein